MNIRDGCKRFMVDDAGSLIDMDNRNTYDYVSDVCEFLNELHEENEYLKQAFNEVLKDLEGIIFDKELLEEENEKLKQQVQSILKLTKKIEDCTHDVKLIGDVE